MAGARKSSKKAETVSAYMQRLEHPLKAEIEALRQVILGANDRIGEEIKWNAPSFYVDEHFATFNLRSAEHVLIIFHMGAKVREDSGQARHIEDPAGLLEWITVDRAAAKFCRLSDVDARRSALADVVNQWIAAR
jgi:hypothetical protein